MKGFICLLNKGKKETTITEIIVLGEVLKYQIPL